MANKGGRLCLGTKGSPSHNDCAAAVGDHRRGDPSRSRKKDPALRHPLLRGWGASATLRYTKEMGSLPETHLTPQEGKPDETGGSGPPPRSPRQQDDAWVGREQAAGGALPPLRAR